MSKTKKAVVSNAEPEPKAAPAPKAKLITITFTREELQAVEDARAIIERGGHLPPSARPVCLKLANALPVTA